MKTSLFDYGSRVCAMYKYDEYIIDSDRNKCQNKRMYIQYSACTSIILERGFRFVAQIV